MRNRETVGANDPKSSKLYRFLYPDSVLLITGCLLVLLGLVHIPLFLVGEQSWEGNVSWRKPILFGISTGVTLISVDWVYHHLTSRRFDRTLKIILSLTLFIEVILISIQQWRGAASHFNRETFFDAIVDTSMVVLISVAFLGICYVTWRSFGQIALPVDQRAAARLGLLFLVMSCVVGYIISFHGYSQVERGLDSRVVGSQGVAKFPHGIAIHALQFFPLLIYVARTLEINLRERTTLLFWFATAMLLAFLFACYQTLFGFGRAEISSPIGLMLLCASVAAFAWPGLVLAHKTCRKFAGQIATASKRAIE